MIAATNRIELIDPALLRPGRFDYQIRIPLPNEAGRKEILGIHLRLKPVSKDLDLDLLVKETKGFSGAHLAEVCRRATLSAFRENGFIAANTCVEMRNLIEAVRMVRTTVKDVERHGIGFVPHEVTN